MPKIMKSYSHKVGLPPGTLVYLDEPRVEHATITVMDYSNEGVQERVVGNADECRPFMDTSSVTWINVVGLHDMNVIETFGRCFGIHPLVLEDIVNVGQRPRIEDHEDYLYAVLRMLYRGKDDGDIVAEQVSIILGPNYVLSFQEIEGDVFDLIRDRIRAAKGRIRGMGCDYLAYSLMDAIVDNYFVVLEDVSDSIEQIQEQVIEEPTPLMLEAIHRLKRELIFVRKSLWPTRELVSAMERSESNLIGDAMSPYLRDVYEHTIQSIDTVESLRDMLVGALDIYMSGISNRMNAVMKVLTVIATVFIPLTFIAGVYGMNFRYMPELAWRYGYAGTLGLMALIGIGMAWFFKRKNWF